MTRILEKYNPATDALMASYPMADEAQIAQAVERSRLAGVEWKKVSFSKRAVVLRQVAQFICQQPDELAQLISAETGKPIKDAWEADLTTARSILEYTARVGPRVLRDRHRPWDKSILLGRVHTQIQEPRGVVGVISPWNYPFSIAMSGISAALMGGNTVLFKPSELTPGVGQKTVELFHRALRALNLPSDVLQLVQGDGTVGAQLVQAGLDYVIFTGSAKTGYQIRNTLLQQGKEVSLELGGSDPVILLESADLDVALSSVLWGRYTNAGQTCAAVKRLYVPNKLYIQVIALLKEKIAQLRQGPPDEMRCHMGPLISKQQRQQVHEQVLDAVARGAVLEVGGQLPDDQPGCYYPPTLLSHIPSDARVLQEEVFGPVLAVVPYNTVQEAIELANQSAMGLTGSVFGEPGLAQQVARQLDVGLATVNDIGLTNYAFPAIPWEGRKQSGPGTSHSETGILSTTLQKNLTLNWFTQKQPYHFTQRPNLNLSKALLSSYGSQCPLAYANPNFLIQFLKSVLAAKL